MRLLLKASTFRLRRAHFLRSVCSHFDAKRLRNKHQSYVGHSFVVDWRKQAIALIDRHQTVNERYGDFSPTGNEVKFSLHRTGAKRNPDDADGSPQPFSSSPKLPLACR